MGPYWAHMGLAQAYVSFEMVNLTKKGGGGVGGVELAL